MGTEGFLPGTKRSGSEADRSPLCNVDNKNKWSYSSVHPTRVKGNHRDNFTSKLPDAHGANRVKCHITWATLHFMHMNLWLMYNAHEYTESAKSPCAPARRWK